MSNIVDWRARVGQLAKNNRFRVRINPATNIAGDHFLQLNGVNTLRDLEFHCTDTEIAGRSLLTNDVRYYGPASKSPHQTQYTDLAMTFYTRENMREHKFFHQWMDFIHGYGSYDLRFPDQYRTEITIEKLSEVKNNVQLTMTLKKAFPINISAVPLSWAEETFVRTTVQFGFTEFEIT